MRKKEIKNSNNRLVKGTNFFVLLCVIAMMIGTVPATAVRSDLQTKIGGQAGNPETNPANMPLSPLPPAFQMFFDGFDTFSTKWVSTVITGGDPHNKWEGVQTGTLPTCNPHGGSWMAEYYSYFTPYGQSAQLTTKKWISLFKLFYPTRELTFWMYHDTGMPTTLDKVELYVSKLLNNPNHQWDLLGTYYRYDGTTGWEPHNVSLSSYRFNLIKIGFRGVSAYGYNMYLDDVVIWAL